ncbi:MAG TPA: ATP-binding protein [Anaerolineales bacterium]|jgi:anti-sigma regulatory factor (Ser/Thr protein kinase)|nr:ATP-binding protein [Anaerolineales bacterium]
MDKPASLQLVAGLKDLAEIRHFVEEEATALDVEPSAIYDINLAVTEMVTNIIVHGYRGQPGRVEIEVGREGDSVVIRLRDQAPVFDPTQVPPPNLELPPEERPLGGLGVFLTKHFMDRMSHRITASQGNELTLVKKNIIMNSDQEEEHANQC